MHLCLLPPLLPFLSPAHLINDANTPSNRGHYSQCRCVHVWPHTLEKSACGTGRWVSLSDPISLSGPCTTPHRVKIRWKCNHNQLGSGREQTHMRAHTPARTPTHTHVHAQAHIPFHHCKGTMQKIVLDMVMRRRGPGCGEEGELFNLHF